MKRLLSGVVLATLTACGPSLFDGNFSGDLVAAVNCPDRSGTTTATTSVSAAESKPGVLTVGGLGCTSPLTGKIQGHEATIDSPQFCDVGTTLTSGALTVSEHTMTVNAVYKRPVDGCTIAMTGTLTRLAK